PTHHPMAKSAILSSWRHIQVIGNIQEKVESGGFRMKVDRVLARRKRRRHQVDSVADGRTRRAARSIDSERLKHVVVREREGKERRLDAILTQVCYGSTIHLCRHVGGQVL